MRCKLKHPRKDCFYSFTGYVRNPSMKIRGVRAILVSNVRLKGRKVTSHVWLKLGESFCSLNIKPGMFIRFKSRVVMYSKTKRNKNNTGQLVDYGLSNPIYVEIITKEEHFFSPKKE